MTRQTAADDPFEALGLAPTFDLGQVKRAYFAALQRHGPLADPEGFRRVRAAYEALSSPQLLARAYARRPLDLDAELRRWDAEFAGRAEAARRAKDCGRRSAQALERFVEGLSVRTLARVLSGR